MDSKKGGATALISIEPSGGTAKEDAQKEWPLWKLGIVGLPCMTITVMWSFILPNSVPYMVQLGMSPAAATLNNMAGPVCGFFAGPLVGAYSDSLTSPYGRRRPIIVAGLSSMWVAGLLFSSSPMLLPPGVAVVFAAVMLWLLDLTINVLQTPMRALVADLASASQQVQVQVMVACFQAVGFLVGFSIMKMYTVPAEHMLEVTVLVCALNTATVAAMLCVTEEKPWTATVPGRACTPLKDTMEAVRGSSRLLRELAAVHCLVWIGIAVWQSYSGHWFSMCVFPGKPEAKAGSAAHHAYASGQEAFAHSGQCKSFVHLLSALAVIFVLQRTRISPRVLYAVCIFVGAIASYVAAFFVKHDMYLAEVCMVFSVLPFVGAQSVPFGLVAVSSKAAQEHGRQVTTALQMALLNCSLTLGQQITHMSLAALEGSMALELALPTMLAAAAAAQFAGGVGALLLTTGTQEYHSLSNGKEVDPENGRALAAPVEQVS